ncbi:MAG: biopolymer transporter ExbD [Kordiimonadales bacterium]|nr:MAG: biopolymer transporter ExbD [Kordiimonadales bacterium]
MRNHAQQEDEAEINMTPMLDVVFIMLIFFIVTAVFVKESGFAVTKPTTKNAQFVKDVSILIAISDDGKIWINREIQKLEAVRTAVEKMHSENPKGAISIQADKDADAVLVMKVYDAVRDADIKKIIIGTEVN